MIELLPLANLMPALFEGDPSTFTPDFPSEGFKALLFNQIIQMEEEVCKEGTEQSVAQVPLVEESFSPPSDEKKSLFYNPIQILHGQTLLHPVNLPNLPEGQEFPVLPQPLIETPLIRSAPNSFPDAVGKEVQGEAIFFSEKTGERRESTSFVPQSLKEDAIERSIVETKSKEMSFHPSLLEREKDVMEKVHELFQRENGSHKAPPSMFQGKGQETAHFPDTGKTEGDRQSLLTSSHPTTAPSEKAGTELIGKVESNGDPHLNRSNADAGDDSRRSVPLKDNSSPSESFLIQSKVGSESKNGPVISGEDPKAQKVFSAKIESFELYHQVGRKMAWSIQNGEERVRLALDPPRLGNLYMEVAKEGEMVKATLWAENHVTKELLEAHRMELRRILEEDGFKLERFDVFVRQETDRFMERRGFAFPGDRQDSRERTKVRAHLPSEFSEACSIEGRPFFRQSSYIDRII